MLSTRHIKLSAGAPTTQTTGRVLPIVSTAALALCRVFFLLIPILVGRTLAYLPSATLDQLFFGMIAAVGALIAGVLSVAILVKRQAILQIAD